MMEPIQQTGQNASKCLNCGAELNDRFCGHCGQDSKEFKLSVWRLFGQFFESITEFDSKFFKTIIPLLFRPAYLTRQFLAGKRKSFLNPIQMYVFCSFIFFLTVSLVGSNKIELGQKDFISGGTDGLSGGSNAKDSLDFDEKEKITNNKQRRNNKKVTINKLSLNFGEEAKTVQEYDSMQAVLPLDKRDGMLKSWMIKKVFKIESKYKSDSQSFLNAMGEKFQENLPNLIFVLLPFFALLLKLLYIRRRFFYVEHLLFSVHIHCFVFITATVGLALDELNVLSETMATLFLWIILGYLFLAMKRMYEQSWLRTMAKFIVFGMLYGILLVIGVVFNLLATIALLDA